MATKRFQGYASPTYTPVPDELFDEQLPDLSGAELKVLLYIMRRTFGFKKESDNISINQLLHGITARTGERCDRGTGLSRSTLVAALRGLVVKNLIITEQRWSKEKGNEATNYRLNLLYHPGSKIEPGESENRTRLVRKSYSQETTRQETSVSFRSSKGHALEAERRRHAVLEQPDVSLGHTVQQPVTSYRTASPSVSAPTGFTPVAQALHRSRFGLLGRVEPASSTPRLPRHDAAVSEQLVACITDIAEEFGDIGHLRSNLTQARHLAQQVGIEESLLVARLYEARAITKDRRKSPVVGGGQHVARPMAYFWIVVRDLFGLRPDNAEANTVPDVSDDALRQEREGDGPMGQSAG